MRYVVRFFDGKITVETVVGANSARMALSVAKGLIKGLNAEMGYKNRAEFGTFHIKAVTPIIPVDYY